MNSSGLFLLLSLLPHFGLAITCFRCKTGYITSEVCSNQLEAGFASECDGPNSQCYESIQWFANGALRLAIRDCWTPPNNATIGGFCENYDQPQGVLKHCRNCTEDMCNTSVMYSPLKLSSCYT